MCVCVRLCAVVNMWPELPMVAQLHCLSFLDGKTLARFMGASRTSRRGAEATLGRTTLFELVSRGSVHGQAELQLAARFCR